MTVGSALPHLLAFLGGADWRATVVADLGAGGCSAALCGARRAARAAPRPRRALRSGGAAARLDATGGSGSPISATSGTCGSSTPSGPGSAPPPPRPSPARLGDGATAAARLLTFAAIALGGLLCQPAGRLADRIGKARVARAGDGGERRRRARDRARLRRAGLAGGAAGAGLGRGGDPRLRRSSPRWSPTPRPASAPAACSPCRPRWASPSPSSPCRRCPWSRPRSAGGRRSRSWRSGRPSASRRCAG